MLNSSPLILPPLSLYIHIPWCIKKCPYCDFNSHETHRQKTFDEVRYIEALKHDLHHEKVWAKGRKLHSIFFGGGTPSLFSANAIDNIIQYASNTIGFEPGIEITLEANPSTFEQEKFSDFFKAGVNRLSIGVQSFNPQHLTTLGRIHNSDEAKHAIVIAQQAGFTNINIDLMHGLPEQSIDDAMNDLQTAIGFSPQHISWYQLTIEPNTHFYHQPPPLPAEDTLADIQHDGGELLTKHGFTQYEISAFSKTNHRSKHNLNYWQFGDYLGIGAGAHGKVTDINNKRILRRQKTRLPEHYLDYQINDHHPSPRYKEQIVDAKELPLEFMMNVLRLNDGVPMHLFEQRTGLNQATISDPLHHLQQHGFLSDNPQQIVTTTLGAQFLNTVLEKFNDQLTHLDLIPTKEIKEP
jgi:putative oxygen-independent coproporphyrinogen III oxidase